MSWVGENGRAIRGLNLKLMTIEGVRSVGPICIDGVWVLDMSISVGADQTRIREEAVAIAREHTGNDLPAHELRLTVVTWGKMYCQALP